MNPCDSCGSVSFRTIYRSHPILDGPLVRCETCGLVHVNPPAGRYRVDDDSGIQKRQEAYDSQASKVRTELCYDAELEASERSVRERFWHERIGRVERTTPRGRLLDIGSDGQFLSLARNRGWTVEGVQPHEATCASARSLYGIDLVPTTLAEADFRPESFDAITIFHVIEHVPSPAALCRQVLPLLRPGGAFFVETPNIDSFWFHVLGQRWRQFIPDHYWFFSPTTLGNLLSRAGFGVLQITRVGKAVSLGLLLNRCERIVGRPLPTIGRVLRRLRLDRKVVWVNPGDIILAVARRPRSIQPAQDEYVRGPLGDRQNAKWTLQSSAIRNEEIARARPPARPNLANSPFGPRNA